GRITAHHRAQAEVYVRQGSLPAAIEQLESARRANDGDFFELSAVDARLRTLKAELRAQREEEARR
ncbi:MAG: M48 family peptidase, partial [Zoogloeaceae bacterium]|nr:M48 family peptidase [Zoogloeaceae bacterium]